MTDQDMREELGFLRRNIEAVVASCVTLDNLEDWAHLHDPDEVVGWSYSSGQCPVACFLHDVFPSFTGPYLTEVSVCTYSPLSLLMGEASEHIAVMAAYWALGEGLDLHTGITVPIPDGRVACVLDAVDGMCDKPWRKESKTEPGTIDAGTLYAICRAVRRNYMGLRKNCAYLIAHEFEENVHAVQE